YTNGAIIAEKKLAGKLAELGNVIPCVSVEGFEEETDARRGKGTHKKIRKAMRMMKEAGMLFGYSATPMRHNNELLCSDKFVEYYMDLGCNIGWYFNYMPVGRDPDLSLMPTPAQRLHRYHRIRAIREKYGILAADFWCDGALVGGCLSGGRTYFHVNASGGVEPCVFHQFSVDNINEKSLLECLNSDYFREIRKKLREVENPLRPCPIIDNPQMLRHFVKKYNPKPSQPGGDALLYGELAKGLDEYAAEMKRIFDPVFEQVRHLTPWPLEPMGTIEQKKAAWEAFKRKVARA
ncbi:MAG: radical SAM protein, partial [Deltaproteobacteria bacterium]